MSSFGGQEAEATCSRLGANVQELIPGLPDDITLAKVATKLAIQDIDTLFSVSRGWFHAIRSRQVYDARGLANSRKRARISYYSPAENVFAVSLHSNLDFKLPSLRSLFFGREVPPGGRSVLLNARVYVFGGLDCKVYVIDVAGHRQWRRCANMLNPKVEFGCGTIDGKIYVFGGAVSHESSSVSELYNPRDKTRSEIRKIVPLLCSHSPATKRRGVSSGVYENNFFHPEVSPRMKSPPQNSDPLEVYDPIKDEWRVVEPVGTAKEIMFVARGKFFSMSPLGVHIYDFHRNSWGDLHSFSFSGFAPGDPVHLVPIGILTESVEVLAVVDWPNAGTNRSCTVQSKRLGRQNKETVWYKPEYFDTRSRDTEYYNWIEL